MKQLGNLAKSDSDKKIDTIPHKIREIRLHLGMTQEQFAHALGITVTTVNRWENGHSQPSRMASAALFDLCEKRGVAITPDDNFLRDTRFRT